MFLTPWYFTMIVIIIATSIYQNYWMKENGFRKAKKPTKFQIILSWFWVLIPILNTIFGIICALILLLFAFAEDFMVEAFENSKDFERVHK